MEIAQLISDNYNLLFGFLGYTIGSLNHMIWDSVSGDWIKRINDKIYLRNQVIMQKYENRQRAIEEAKRVISIAYDSLLSEQERAKAFKGDKYILKDKELVPDGRNSRRNKKSNRVNAKGSDRSNKQAKGTSVPDPSEQDRNTNP